MSRTSVEDIRELLLERLAIAGVDDMHESGEEHRGTCPHCGKPDRFKIGERTDGDGYWVKCYAHCQQRDILDVLELTWRDLRISSAGKDRSAKLRAPELTDAKPIRWLWQDRIPLGRISLLIANEGTGKGTVAAYVTSRLTRGQLEGDLKGEPATVLIIGTEDLLHDAWIPRLHLVDADFSRVRFQEAKDFEINFADQGDIEHVREWIQAHQIKAVVFDALLDHVGGAGTDEYKPRQVRAALAPLRHLAGEEEIAVLGSMHPRKGKVQTFRELVAASHQFNAVSRSSMLLAPHPESEDRRVLALGKSNHAGGVPSLEFRVEVVHFELNGFRFRDVRAVDWSESDVDLDAAMQASTGARDTKPSKVALAGDAICEALQDGERLSSEVKAEVRKKVGCGLATVDRAAAELREDHVLGTRGETSQTVWFLLSQLVSSGESTNDATSHESGESPINTEDSGDSQLVASSPLSPNETSGDETNGGGQPSEREKAADLLRRAHAGEFDGDDHRLDWLADS